ncbi:hypothetical protein BC828DRAFT_401225 [Blastocladiella britannica]|nr:hypothetical protein BC828DRAFT_401225 [Blastocladiella britannica]
MVGKGPAVIAIAAAAFAAATSATIKDSVGGRAVAGSHVRPTTASGLGPGGPRTAGRNGAARSRAPGGNKSRAGAARNGVAIACTGSSRARADGQWGPRARVWRVSIGSGLDQATGSGRF